MCDFELGYLDSILVIEQAELQLLSMQDTIPSELNAVLNTDNIHNFWSLVRNWLLHDGRPLCAPAQVSFEAFLVSSPFLEYAHKNNEAEAGCQRSTVRRDGCFHKGRA